MNMFMEFEKEAFHRKQVISEIQGMFFRRVYGQTKATQVYIEVILPILSLKMNN